MELELHKGRPADKRIDKEERCYALLDSLGIEYYRVDHEHADTIEACHGIESVLGCGICKNLFLCNRQATEFYLLLLPGDKPFKTKLLSKQIGSARLSFASAEHMEAAAGHHPRLRQCTGADERYSAAACIFLSTTTCSPTNISAATPV